ncbi:Asp-tRNA(Asn)/Glu-tRNA(Gln) amidotransferase subunit GatC [Syntrophothermus lipocalidus]|uniref:Aspartyl/glutamyl-tRNA(Asn/Gln) amidotransferase subunit C n=1 Tax=Syntrophothermus lipocalidus (strain DSM 12680 / TGB-C1) TaxID=643648 RepID=D7CKQ4_SYNLT|nr:Asp-tRNA(Asn)/Glu-tRNA(Gln) amidotransferase subunit GatC [Syntrophothermus lipocalidus]ADI01289.1 glutamyl-tRNA(Gln) amidotransferase, C subunit [Syntrophothermus lipocalidus DSM 12680]HOV43292.1 Asp-tRNA(Asn)/Glu-tRNA(Gln) amidotransferase subunit GatC [Syntrophothermus lipocalidus]
MLLTREEVEHVAALARLKLSDEELERFAEQLTAILDYMSRLNDLDTSKIEPLTHVLPLSNVFRDDGVSPEETNRDDILANAPLEENGCFKVPRIV